ncbi:MAG TPA: Holliday junction resolvase-like protein [Acidimicrobiales bacterium]|nr:Holliday junction resolvase-like protein [Acidimicrobiales bacterium]
MGATVAALVAVVVVAVVIAWALLRVQDARRDRDVHLRTYCYTEEDLARFGHEAIRQSHAVVSGKVQEHMAPLFPEFMTEFNPREARFIGTPVDYVVFDGIDSGECGVVFIEVKTGRSQLSTRERRVRRAVEAGRVRWVEMRLPEELSTALATGVVSALPGASC